MWGRKTDLSAKTLMVLQPTTDRAAIVSVVGAGSLPKFLWNLVVAVVVEEHSVAGICSNPEYRAMVPNWENCAMIPAVDYFYSSGCSPVFVSLPLSSDVDPVTSNQVAASAVGWVRNCLNLEGWSPL